MTLRRCRREAGFWVPRFLLRLAKAARPPLMRAAFPPKAQSHSHCPASAFARLQHGVGHAQTWRPASLLGDSLRLLTLALLPSSFHSPQQILGSFRTETKAVCTARLLETADSLRRPPLERFIGNSRFATAVEQRVFVLCVCVHVLSDTGFLYVTPALLELTSYNRLASNSENPACFLIPGIKGMGPSIFWYS